MGVVAGAEVRLALSKADRESVFAVRRHVFVLEQLGYAGYGDLFFEAGIEHISMVKQL